MCWETLVKRVRDRREGCGRESHLVYTLVGWHAVGWMPVPSHVLGVLHVLSGRWWPRQGHSQASILIQGEDVEFRGVRFGRYENYRWLPFKYVVLYAVLHRVKYKYRKPVSNNRQTVNKQHKCISIVLLKMWTTSQTSNLDFDYRHQGFSVTISELEEMLTPTPGWARKITGNYGSGNHRWSTSNYYVRSEGW